MFGILSRRNHSPTFWSNFEKESCFDNENENRPHIYMGYKYVDVWEHQFHNGPFHGVNQNTANRHISCLLQ